VRKATENWSCSIILA